MPASSSDALSRAVPLIERLVGFDTESSKSNLPLIEFVEDYLGKLDVPFVRVPIPTATKRRSLPPLGR